ncbi:MAG: glycosyltransferase family 9 protein [Micavibrio sp.]|nr:glycosyltransferase family 9 protein [Micavibrio sp.]
MKILFITSSRIGDAVLSSGLLNEIAQNYPDAKVTIVCGPLVRSLFEGFQYLERIIPLKKEKHNKHWLKLLKYAFPIKWDMVVDLRNSAVSRIILAKKRYIFGGHIDKSLHKVAQNAAVMRLDHVPEPKQWISPLQRDKALALIPDGGPVLGIGPTANWIGKTWPAENFIELARWLTQDGGYLAGARIAVFGAPGEEEGAYEVFNAMRSDKRLDLIAKGSPGEAAAALSRCSFYIGNDSGLMHCAAAAGVPTFGVFGPSYPHIYAPYGAHCAYARTPETFDELIDFEGYDPKTLDHSLMTSLSVDVVKGELGTFMGKLKGLGKRA